MIEGRKEWRRRFTFMYFYIDEFYFVYLFIFFRRRWQAILRVIFKIQEGAASEKLQKCRRSRGGKIWVSGDFFRVFVINFHLSYIVYGNFAFKMNKNGVYFCFLHGVGVAVYRQLLACAE